FCHLEERGGVADLSSGIASSSVPRGRWNLYDQRSGCAVLMVESGNAGAIVADPNRAVRRRDRHAPGIDKVWIDVLRNAGDVGLKICPSISITEYCRGRQHYCCQ